VISGKKSSWRPVASDVPQELILVPVLVSVFVNDQEDGRECTLSGFADGTKLGVIHQVVVLPFRGTAVGWRNESTGIACDSAKGKASTAEEEEAQAPARAGAVHLQNGLAEEDLRVLEVIKLTISQQ